MAFFTKRYHPPGTPAGTLIEVPASEASPLRIQMIDYDEDTITIRNDIAVAECTPFLQKDSVTWMHVQGCPTEAALRDLGAAFRLHTLALEDILNTGQRPKIEPFDDQLFVVMSMPEMASGLVDVQQVSFFLGTNFVVSFCERGFASFQEIVKRLREQGSRLRSRGADFLLYSLLDMVIDQGFPVLESFGLELEGLEEEILESATGETLGRIHSVKRELILLRRMLWPQREVINQLLRGDQALVREDTLIYLRDCYDHTIQVMDLLETYRDMTASMLDIYLSSVNNHLNQTMRLLTVIATVFIPLTFIVGVYGMNFDRRAGPWSMPELGWPYGYALVWLTMIVIALSMLLFFRRRKWI
ncbi:MAG: magnesium/cobalt transporter CorA [Gammaproteobacteria bacterium]|nr:magnesium/cobalt transporter CorA [Gammaproteobacteria bacterium]HXK57275.1 magnesium/cobalt transporter CorA [Gammaproteobacteria bacterium]